MKTGQQWPVQQCFIILACGYYHGIFFFSVYMKEIKLMNLVTRDWSQSTEAWVGRGQRISDQTAIVYVYAQANPGLTMLLIAVGFFLM